MDKFMDFLSAVAFTCMVVMLTVITSCVAFSGYKFIASGGILQ